MSSFLKKINPALEKAIIDFGITAPNEVQQQAFSVLKSGIDSLVVAPVQSGKTTLLAFTVIQRLEKAFEQSPRALIIVNNREKLNELSLLLKQFGNNTNLRVFAVHEKGDMDYDKNHVSGGIDILVGTPLKIYNMLVAVGYDVNQLDLFIVDDLDVNIKERHEPIISRIANLLPKKTQQIYFSKVDSQKVNDLADRLLVNPNFITIE